MTSTALLTQTQIKLCEDAKPVHSTFNGNYELNYELTMTWFTNSHKSPSTGTGSRGPQHFDKFPRITTMGFQRTKLHCKGKNQKQLFFAVGAIVCIRHKYTHRPVRSINRQNVHMSSKNLLVSPNTADADLPPVCSSQPPLVSSSCLCSALHEQHQRARPGT